MVAYCPPTTIIIQGNVAINTNIETDADRPQVLIIKGDVTIATAVTKIDAYIISKGNFKTGNCMSGIGCQLTITGGVVSKELKLDRSLHNDNLNNPSEIFVYAPGILWYMREILGETLATFEEVAP